MFLSTLNMVGVNDLVKMKVSYLLFHTSLLGIGVRQRCYHDENVISIFGPCYCIKHQIDKQLHSLSKLQNIVAYSPDVSYWSFCSDVDIWFSTQNSDVRHDLSLTSLIWLSTQTQLKLISFSAQNVLPGSQLINLALNYSTWLSTWLSTSHLALQLLSRGIQSVFTSGQLNLTTLLSNKWSYVALVSYNLS